MRINIFSGLFALIVRYMKKFSRRSDISLRDWPSIYWCVLAISCLALILWLRVGPGTIPYENLWAEDGNVFLTEAFSSGIDSIWRPYAGYLHVLPRTVALATIQFSAEWAPLIFFVSWLVVFAIFMATVTRQALRFRANLIAAVVACLLIALQPHAGETFFNLTNLQWFSGCSLILLVLGLEPRKRNWFDAIFTATASVTGPFSILLIPFLLWRFWLSRSIRKLFYLEWIALAGAMVQISFVITSKRITPGNIDKDILHWFRAIFTFVTFGSQYLLIQIGAIVLWWNFLRQFFVSYRNSTQRKRRELTALRNIFLCGLLSFFAGLWALKEAPQVLDPLSDGNRYFMIPYAMTIFCAVIVLQNSSKKAKISLVIFLSICAIHFKQVNLPDLQFPAFAIFAKSHPGINIPINPQQPVFPGWHFLLPSKEKDFRGPDVSIGLRDVNVARPDSSKENSASFVSPWIWSCGQKKYVGAEFTIKLNKPNWIYFEWSHSENTTRWLVMRRFFPAQITKTHFAFKNQTPRFRLRISVSDKQNDFILNGVDLWCLP